MNHSTSPSPAVAAVLLLAGVGCLSLCLSLPLLWLSSLSFPPSASSAPAAKVAAEPQKQPDEPPVKIVPKKDRLPEPIKPLPEGPPAVATCESLFAEYRANPVDANNRFKGKLVQITGTITNIREDEGRASLEFYGKPDPDKIYRDGLYAQFADPNQLAKLKSGDTVTFVGEGDRWLDNFSAFYVKNCRLISKQP